MRTKVVNLKTGDRVMLYYNEDTSSWTQFKNEAQDVFHKRILKGSDKKAHVIRRYYSKSTVEHTRQKIREMVNESDEKMNLLYQTILTIRG